jgi:alanine racemase
MMHAMGRGDSTEVSETQKEMTAQEFASSMVITHFAYSDKREDESDKKHDDAKIEE